MTTTNSETRRGFSMIELLVVVVILLILMAMIVPKAGDLIARSRENTCRNNLRQLQAAVTSYMNDHSGNLPFAMCFETFEHTTSTEVSTERLRYQEQKAWIRWSPDQNPDANTLEKLKKRWKDKPFETHAKDLYHDLGVGDLARFGVENGTLFEYMGKSFENYVCPAIRLGANAKEKIWRTYAMNPFFYCPELPSREPRKASRIGASERFGSYTPEAAKLLLFVEVRPDEKNKSQKGAPNPNYRGYCCILPEGKDDFNAAAVPPYADIKSLKKTEYMHKSPSGAIGTSPTSGSNKDKVVVAMAVFFDGHIEKIVARGINPVWAYNRGLDPWRKEGSE